MGYTPFKMKGPSLYKSPAKDDEQAKARENVKAMDKESDKLKTDLSKQAKKQSIPTISKPNKRKPKISQEQRGKNKKALETHRTRVEKTKNKKDNKGGVDRYNAVVTKYDKDGKVDDRDKWKRTPDWMK